MINFHYTGYSMIIILVTLFSAWFIYQDILSLSVNQAEMIVFLIISILIRIIGFMTGFFPIRELPVFCLFFLLINLFIGFLCLKKWMGWGDFIMIAGLLMVLRTEDMVELILFSFAFSAIISLILLMVGCMKMKTPLPFLPFLVIGFYLSIIFQWNLL